MAPRRERFQLQRICALPMPSGDSECGFEPGARQRDTERRFRCLWRSTSIPLWRFPSCTVRASRWRRISPVRTLADHGAADVLPPGEAARLVLGIRDCACANRKARSSVRCQRRAMRITASACENRMLLQTRQSIVRAQQLVVHGLRQASRKASTFSNSSSPDRMTSSAAADGVEVRANWRAKSQRW